jgi:HEPN domain-containing protein
MATKRQLAGYMTGPASSGVRSGRRADMIRIMIGITGKLDDIREIYSQAVEYQRAAELLGESDNRHEVTSPWVTCCALSLELYLKCLLHLETATYPRGHKLLKLFEALSPERQDRIEAHYLDFRTIKSTEKPNRSGYALRELLSISNMAFDDWRYSFEDRKKKLHFCAGVIIPCVKRAIAEACPLFPNEDDAHPSLRRGIEIVRH